MQYCISLPKSFINKWAVKFKLSIYLLLVACKTIAQDIPAKDFDMFAHDIQKNIFRLTLMLHEEAVPVLFSYEREIKKPFTLVLKLGPAFRHAGFDADSSQLSINGLIAGEFRYYYNLPRRIRKKKPVHNFSACYISLEHEIITNPIIAINGNRTDRLEGSSKTFLNWGIQKQYKRGYLNVFLGTSINTNELKKGTIDLFGYHYGVALGIVLFE